MVLNNKVLQMQNCTVCLSEINSVRSKKYCSKACEVKGWKLNNREAYLRSKREYRANHSAEAVAYNRQRERTHPSVPQKTRRLFYGSPCLRCDSKINIELHHIKSQEYGGDEKVSNITALCHDCHVAWHKMFPLSFWHKPERVNIEL